MEVGIIECAGRLLAEEVISEVDVPSFPRATMDGYAVRGADTFGASPYDPVPLRPVGESMPGRACEAKVGPGTACRIMTGAPIPEGADAVLRAEDAEEAGRVVRVRAASLRDATWAASGRTWPGEPGCCRRARPR